MTHRDSTNQDISQSLQNISVIGVTLPNSSAWNTFIFSADFDSHKTNSRKERSKQQPQQRVHNVLNLEWSIREVVSKGENKQIKQTLSMQVY